MQPLVAPSPSHASFVALDGEAAAAVPASSRVAASLAPEIGALMPSSAKGAGFPSAPEQPHKERTSAV
jgi:hypothetical protein